jgi:hypothetical protein
MLRSCALVLRRGGVQMHTSYRSVTGLASGMLRESIINHTRDKFISEEESFIVSERREGGRGCSPLYACIIVP